MIPNLATERLLLRPPGADDFETYRAFYADAEASALYGGPLAPAQAWRKLAYDIGHWTLRGHGMWSVCSRDSGEMIGGCGIVHPEGWPRAELTWWIIPAARRSGYAIEASCAAIAFGYDTLGWPVVETHMNDANEAARNLALKLGGRIIARETFPDGLARTVYALPHPGARA
jgi:[ribosomal protein S5]-alanine N-acetyltransferase